MSIVEEKELISLDEINIKCEMCGIYFRVWTRIQAGTFRNEPSYNLCKSCYKDKRIWIHRKIKSILLWITD